MASCNSTYSNMEYYLSGKEATKNKTWLNFDIEKESYINGRRDYKVCYNVFMHYDNEKPYYIVNDSTTMTLFMVSPKRVEIANSQNQELTCFMNRRDEKSRYYDFFKAQIYTTVFEFIPYYFAGFPPSLGINRLIVNDVMTIHRNAIRDNYQPNIQRTISQALLTYRYNTNVKHGSTKSLYR